MLKVPKKKGCCTTFLSEIMSHLLHQNNEAYMSSHRQQHTNSADCVFLGGFSTGPILFLVHGVIIFDR